jgi:stage II sporulation protein AB (anti-sigma F factor)
LSASLRTASAAGHAGALVLAALIREFVLSGSDAHGRRRDTSLAVSLGGSGPSGIGVTDIRERLKVRHIFELELGAVPAAVPEARNALTAACSELGIDAVIQEEIRLAVTEACGNCVLHAYAGAPTGRFTVRASIDDDVLCIAVEDSGAGLPEGGPPGDGAGTAASGYGLQLIRTLASKVDVTSHPGRGTRVAMRFPLQRSSREAGERTSPLAPGSSACTNDHDSP